MSNDPQAPDRATIDAWLAGDLDESQVAGVEQYFEEHPLEEMGWEAEDPVEGLGDLRRGLPVRSVELTQLIDVVRTKHAPDLPAPEPDAWKQVLEPSDDPGVLGTLGVYEVLEVIATGGMGILLKARDPELRRVAALKVLSPELASNTTARERFLREARAAAKLEHENILPIYGVHPEAVPYFAMRYVAGGSLQDALDEGREFTLDELKRIARQTAAALGSAHAAGIVHRDIKPGNILLEDGCERLWVCDFGIARSIEDPALTYPGSVAGTPQYMSPEQAEGEPLDGRSDLFSLGAVLYRCATGENAFAGETTASVLKNVSATNPAIATGINRALPGWFERLLSTLLAKDVGDRFTCAEDVLRAIDDEHVARPKHRVRRRRRLVAIGLLLMAILCVLQVGAVRDSISRVLVGTSDRVVTIEGRIGAFRSLNAAVRAARAGDVIEIHGDGQVVINAVEIPAEKPLTLRSAAGSTPVLVADLKSSGIVADGPLTLEGLEFCDLTPVYSSGGLLIFRCRGNVVRDCVFRCDNPDKKERLVRRPRAISFSNGAEATFDRCRFELDEVNAFLLMDRRKPAADLLPSSLVIRDSIIVAKRVVDITYTDSGLLMQIKLERCLVSAEALVHDFWNNELSPLEIEVTACTLDLSGTCLWMSAKTRAAIQANILWRGVDNIYRKGAHFLHNDRQSAIPRSGGIPAGSIGGWVDAAWTDETGWEVVDFPLGKPVRELAELLGEKLPDHPAVSALSGLPGVEKVVF